MQMFSRVTNSVVMTAALLAVIIGSLCFSAGEGLRLTPFSNATLAASEDAGDLKDAGTNNEDLVAKYGPLDVPAPAQTRGKRQSVDLVCDVVAGTRSVITSVVRPIAYEEEVPRGRSFIAPDSGRAPPFQS